MPDFLGGLQALAGINIQLKEGKILAVIGHNGDGKTCLLNCINGFYHPQEGQVLFDSKDSIKILPTG